MKQMIYELQDSLADHIATNFFTNAEGNTTVAPEFEELLSYVDRNGEARVLGPSLVMVGRFQDDPTILAASTAIPSAYIEIFPNDPDEPGQWMHTLVGSDERLGYPRQVSYEVGGTSMWWRRFTLRFTIFFIDSDQVQQEAARLSSAFAGYLEMLIDSSTTSEHVWGMKSNGSRIVDPFGERCYQAVVARTEVVERGGPENDFSGDYIWDGKIWFQVMTSKE